MSHASRLSAVTILAGLLASCGEFSTPAGFVTLAVPSSPNNLDPRVGTDEVSQRAHQLIFNNLLTLDDRLQVVPGLAEGWSTPDVARMSSRCDAVSSSTMGTS
jgi:ABC-type transport system substrate-binding protein